MAGSAVLRIDAPATRGAARAGLDQRAGSGRIGFRQESPAGQGRGERVVMHARGELDQSYAELGRDIGCRGAAEAVAAARKALVVAVLMLMRGSGFPVVVGVLLRAGLGMSDIHMQPGMGVAARKRKRQQHDQAAQDEGPLRGDEHATPEGLKGSTILA